MNKKVSVAIPTYNRLGYLKECIKSILAQTFQDFDIFVFDNASDQPVEEELKKFSSSRIHFIGNTANVGSVKNHNRIFSYPFESKYLVVFHDDDAMHPRMLELESKFLDERSDAVFAISDLRHVTESSLHQFQNIDENKITPVIYQSQVEFAGAVMRWLRYAFSSTMYRVVRLKGAQMDFDKFSDFADLAFLSEMSKKGPVIFLNEKLVNYRIHPQQDSGDLKETYEQGAIELLRFYEEILPSAVRRFSPNFLFRAYANINRGFPDFKRFSKKCREKGVLSWSDLLFLDKRGAASLLSIILRNKKIIEKARWLKNSLPL